MDNQTRRATVAQANRDALSAVCEEFGIRLRPDTYAKWRPTVRTYGSIRGVEVGVRCVATDGLLGVFVPVAADGHRMGRWFLGHVAWFEWSDGDEQCTGAPATLFSVSVSGTVVEATRPKARAPKVLTERQRKLLEM